MQTMQNSAYLLHIRIQNLNNMLLSPIKEDCYRDV